MFDEGFPLPTPHRDPSRPPQPFGTRLPAFDPKAGKEPGARPIAAPPRDHPQPLGSAATQCPVPGRILIVDDNRDAADSMGMLLRIRGADVRVAYDGREALAVARHFKPTAVLLDIGLPAMNGYEVARELRRLPETARALLVATTGWSQASDVARSQEAGFDHHLVKPVEPATLLDLLNAPPVR